MQAYDLSAGNVGDGLIQKGPGLLKQFGPDLLDQSPPFCALICLGEMLLSEGKNTVEPNDNHIVKEIRSGLVWPPPHVFLFKLYDGLADLVLNLTFAHCHIKLISTLSGKLADIMKKGIWRQRISEMRDLPVALISASSYPLRQHWGRKRKGL